MKNKPVYDGKLIKLYSRRVTLPNGYTVDLEIIEHPGAALIVPFVSRDRIVMLRQYRAAVGRFLFELPAGTRNKGESELSCAKREIVEETGYTARRFTVMGDIFPVPGYSTEKIRIFRAQGLVLKKSCLEADEVVSVHLFTRAAVARLFKAKKISDAKTICALAMCGWL